MSITRSFISAPTSYIQLIFIFKQGLLHVKIIYSWGEVNCAATQELPSILWKPKVQYPVQKTSPLVPILCHINPIHSIPSYLSKIHFNIVHHLRLGLPSGFFPSGFPLPSHSGYMPRPSHPSLLDHSNYTWRRVQVMWKLLTRCSNVSLYSKG
jgi:hypothetical protein